MFLTCSQIGVVNILAFILRFQPTCRRRISSFLTFLCVFGLTSTIYSQTVFWTETFDGTVCAAGSGCDPSLVAWNRVSLGGEGASANRFYVSCQENGNAAGVCGSGCGTDQSLHIGNVSTSSAAFLFCPGGDCGAAYDATGAAEVANTRCESPTVSCAGYSTISLNYVYIERGQTTLDNASVWYFDGTTWAFLYETPKTNNTGCLGQGRWTASISIALPASANNNPNVKIGFRWVNNGDGTGSDPSFAVDDVTLSYLTVLPVELVSFSAVRLKNGQTNLIWETMSETNNDYFMVEKSYDGENFFPVLKRKGAGFSNRPLIYSENDQEDNHPESYYRLKQVDFNGDFSYSQVVRLKDSETESGNFLLYPNPASDYLNFISEQGEIEDLEIRILDIRGALIQEGKYKEVTEARIQLSEIPAGLYIAELNMDGVINRKIFVKE